MMNMELGLGNTLLAGDPRLVDHIVGEVKSQGIFDQFRKECIADVDTKPAYQNLRTRVESSVNSFLSKQTWKADLNKNQLRETLRKHIHEAPYLDAGVERIVDQVVNPKVFSVFTPQIEDVVCKFLGLERPKDRRRNGPCGFKDLLPIDLDPVSPESDKNSLKDVSLDSVDSHRRVDEQPDEAIPKEAPSTSLEQTRKEDDEIEKNSGRNGHANEDASLEVPSKPPSATPNLDTSSKSDEKVDEEEEDSPMFEPIDIMNLNESHVSNDAHLSGISELTSHRSRSPDFSNDGSRENMDFSNHDSEFSKVSSDSRLSIVTDFGSSNHDSTPFPEPPKDEREKNDRPKDNFRAVREFQSGKGANRESFGAGKEAPQSEPKIRRSISSKETSRDGMEVSSKEPRDGKDKPKDEPSRSKSSREKDSRKDREREISKRHNSYVESKTEKSSGKSKPKENREASRSSLEKAKEKESTARAKECGAAKEVKDLKDMYKEKIRELREKKKDSDKIVKEKDTKFTKETKDKRDSSREKRDSKDHKIATSKSSEKNSGKNSRVSEKEARVGKSDSREKGKREERRSSKEHRSRSSNADEKMDGKRLSRSERDEKMEKSETKQKSLVQKKDSSGRNSEGKRDSKGELEKDKKRRDEKKAKSKDDHSSMRKNSDDRRSTDRDGSNGSNGKNSQKSGSSLGASSGKPATSSLSKESTNTSNSSSETSDSIEESHIDKFQMSTDEKNCREGRETSHWDLDSQAKRLEVGQAEISLPIKKRPLPSDDNAKGEITIKKPKFAKNFQEAKKLMKIRRKMEKEKMRQQRQQLEIVKSESRSESPAEVAAASLDNDILSVPDEERVQIIEVRDEEDDEPYPEMKSDFTLEERSRIIMGGESIFTSDFPMRQFNARSTLSVMELSIRQSLQEMITDNKIDETCEPSNSQSSAEPETEVVKEEPDRTSSEMLGEPEASTSKDSTKVKESEEAKLSRSSEGVDGNGRKVDEDERCEEEIKGAEIGCESETVDGSQTMEIVKTMKEEDDFGERSKVEEIVEAREEEEKWRPGIVEDEEKVEGLKVEDNSRSEFFEAKEKGEVSSCDEKLETDDKGENVETENSKLEIVEKGEKIERREAEEKSTPETVENEEKMETPTVEGKSRSEIVKNKEKIEGRKLDEKSIAESVKDKEKIEARKSEEKSTPEIETKRGREEERRSEEKTTPEITKNWETVEARKSVEKSTSEIVKKPENLDARKSVEKLMPEIVKKPEKVDARRSEEKSTPGIGKKPEKVDARKSEEKSAPEIPKKTKKVKSPKFEEQSTGEIVSKPEIIEPPNCEEKSNREIVKEHKKMRAPKSDEKSTPEVVKEHKNVRAPMSDGKSTPEIGKEKKKVETPKSDEKSTPEIGKEKKKIETPKSEEIVEGKSEGIEPSISGTSQPRLLADSCDREKKWSPTIDEDAACQSDDEPCLYFTVDNDRLDRFTKFMKTLEIDESPRDKCVAEDETDEAVSSNKIVSSVSKTMAPPLPKRKYSTSPLTDILLNNRNNNNDADKITASISVVDESSSNNVIKKRKIGRPRKEKPNLSLCSQQNLLNGENFVMPLSPESDVSATSEKAPSNPIKDEKSRVAVRGSNQRYTSDDLYKPRPLFASSSRRSRRSNQA